MKLQITQTLKRIGLDAEALSGPEWFDKSGGFQSRLAICFGWGTLDSLQYIEAVDMTAGKFAHDDLLWLREELSQPNVCVVAHNANYDLDLLNGTLLDHDLPALPTVLYQDTMNNLKSGKAFRNTLAARCAHYGVNLKTGSPDWRAVLQRNRGAWNEMKDYNLNDVVCTLELERAYFDRGLWVPVRTWRPVKR